MKKTTTTVLAMLAALVMSSSLLATMDHQKAFVAKYPDAKAKLGKCSTCHVKPMPKKGDAEANAYGKDIVAKGMSEDKKTIDFAKVEALDSNGNGKSNLDDIKAGMNPGEAKK